MIQGEKVHRVRVHLTVLAVFAVALTASSAAPALAAAETFTVNSTDDSPLGSEPEGRCETEVPGVCTLRAAVEAANLTTQADQIGFAETPFDGTSTAIALGSELPAIIHPVSIDGRVCPGYAVGIEGPCVEVTLPEPSTKTPFTVKADSTTIKNLSVVGGAGEIDVEGAEGFTATGDWLGITRAGTTGPHLGIGLFLGPRADGATIGGPDPSERNVIGFGGVGILVAGSSNATISGNYLGVKPDGSSLAALRTGVEIVDTDVAMTPEAAEHNLVGGTLTKGEAESVECDGPCNVIVASEVAIEMQGAPLLFTEAATGPTTISGNYIGLSADGERHLNQGAEYDVYAGPNEGEEEGPASVTVGGPVSPDGTYAANGNVLDGAETAVFAENSDGFVVEGNAVGPLPGDPLSDGVGPEEAAVYLTSQGLTTPAVIAANTMTLGHGPVAVESLFEGAAIIGNTVSGGTNDVRTEEDGGGSVIEGNVFDSPDRDAVQIENDGNEIVGNTVRGAGWHGVSIDNAAHNRIGGDSTTEENLIEGSGLGAIEISGEPTTHDEVAGNYGAGNGGVPFIQLSPRGPIAKPNDQIEPPVITGVRESSVEGTARADAKIRVFATPSTVPGALGRVIVTTTADSSGHWTASFATKVPAGTLIVATQTATPGPEGATSEVSASGTTAKDPEEETGGGGGGGSGSTGGNSSSHAPLPPAPAPTTPTVKITKGPKKSSNSTTAKFLFKATPAAGATFECKLDGKKWAKCKSPKTYKGLKPGRHTFQVRASVPGAPASKPAKFQFTVKS